MTKFNLIIEKIIKNNIFSDGDSWCSDCLLGVDVKLPLQHSCLCPWWGFADVYLYMYICTLCLYFGICIFHNTNNIVTFVHPLLSEQECIFILFQTISTGSTLATLPLTTASTVQATKLSAPPTSTTTPSCPRKSYFSFFVWVFQSSHPWTDLHPPPTELTPHTSTWSGDNSPRWSSIMKI